MIKHYLFIALLLLPALACHQAPPTTNDHTEQRAAVAATQTPQATAPKPKCIEGLPANQPRVLASQTFNQPSVNYHGINFSISPQLATTVIAETRSASPLHCETDKPEYDNYPEHHAFRLSGAYASRYGEASEWQPEIRVYPVKAYQQTFAISDSAGTRNFVSADLQQLSAVLASKPMTFEREAPFLHFIDAHQEFRAKVRYLNFKNGQGLAYLTKFGVDAYPIFTNQTPLYIFQGVTADGQFLVSATFPVNIPFLPKNFEAVKPGSLPFDPRQEKDDELTRKRVAAYVAKITQQAEALPDEKYLPNLQLFDELLQTLTINPK